jgi:hypothetical protein
MAQSPVFLEPQWFIPAFLCFWLFVCTVLALAGGWFSLSKEFRSQGNSGGQRFAFVSGALGAWPFPVTSYGGCLFVTVNDVGFQLSILFPFRFLSPPLFIPWIAVKAVDEKRFLFWSYAVIRLNRGWPTVALRGAAGRRVADVYGASQTSVNTRPTAAIKVSEGSN